MNRPPRLLATLFCLTSTAAFGVSALASSIQSYAGNPYLGKVNVRIEVPGESRDSQESGTGSAYFTKTDNGQTRLIVSGSIREAHDTGFAIDGIENQLGWSSDTGDLLVSADGKISGSVVTHPYRQSFDGFVSEGRFNLKVEQLLLEKTKVGAFPPGTKFIFNYTLRREVDENTNTTAAPEEERNGEHQCKRTVWRMRNVANLSGGPMIATQVPVCVKW